MINGSIPEAEEGEEEELHLMMNFLMNVIGSRTDSDRKTVVRGLAITRVVAMDGNSM